jgi:predicted MFS family arabinose efflux permease
MAGPNGRRTGTRGSPRLTVASSLRVRLTLVFFAITLAAVAIVYFYVAPSLESSLRTQKIRNLATAAAGAAPLLARTIGTNIDKTGVDQSVRAAADRTNARVTLLGISSGTL